MGMFNRIWVTCPKCKDQVEFQTKSGTCVLDSWSLEDAPNIEVRGIIDDTNRCDCGKLVTVELNEPPEVKIKTRVY